MSERYFPDSMPPALADATSLPWWEACAEHRLVVQRCSACAHTCFPPSPICPDCRSDRSEWQQVPGRGEVYSYTIVHRPIAGGQELPFVIAVIALEGSGGLRMISNMVDVNPNAVEIGMPVEVVWEDMSTDFAVPRFRPTKEIA